jgi:hypothetical protein
VHAGSSFDQEDAPMLKWLIRNRLKYALGHGKACQRVEVAGEVVVPRRAREGAVLQATS